METGNVFSLHELWQNAVREYAAFLRDARSQGQSQQEIQKRGRIYLLRIDDAFAKLKTAELEARGASGRPAMTKFTTR